MSYRGDSDSKSYEGLGPMGYQSPFPGGKPQNPYDPYFNGPDKRGEPQERVRLQMTPEEVRLATQINSNHTFTRLLPMGIGSFLGVKYLIAKGIIKTGRPGLYYGGAMFGAFVISKMSTIKEVQRQLKEKYPDGVYAQTRNMTPAQMTEYMKQRELQTARARLEASGATVQGGPDQPAHQPAFNPDGSNQSAGLDDRFRPTVDSFDFVKKREEQETTEDPANKKTYANLRQQAHREKASQHLPASLPEQTEKSTTKDDPPSKLRTVRKNKYGDDME